MLFLPVSLSIPRLSSESEYKHKAQASKCWCIIPSLQYTTHPLRVKKKDFTFLSPRKREWIDRFPPPPAVIHQIQGAVPVIQALQVCPVQTEKYQYAQACEVCVGTLREKHSPSSINIFPCGFLVETISFYSPLLQEFTFRPNLQCIRVISRHPDREYLHENFNEPLP